jgi:serine protease Do
MKPSIILPILVALALAGCNRTAPGTAAQAKDTNPAEAQADDPQAPAAPVAFTPKTGSLVSAEEVPLLEQINRENIKVLAAAMPAIVRVTASKPFDPHQLFGNEMPFHFGPGRPHGLTPDEPSYGSGVIISTDGYVVTNEHVIEDTKDVEVQLQDKRSFPARVVASDAPLDVAILKIEATGLTALPWGDSDKVQVGEQVFAIGNPFNLEDSASKGIVSATQRNLPDSSADGPHYEDFIQTDAAINPGNSGGALINIHGELVGLNAAIASFSRGNEGVGFSIPSNLVRYAVDGLLKNGRLVRGYLGVQLPNSIDEGVTEQLGLPNDRGALLAGVKHPSPADEAKLRPVDFITAVDGHPIDGIAHLRLVVAQIPVGKEVVVNYIRDGTEQTTTVKIGELPKDLDSSAHPLAPSPSDGSPANPMAHPAHLDNVLNGLEVADLNDRSRLKFGVDDLVSAGVLVTGVEEGSLAEARGLLPGDVIEVVSTRRASIQTVPNAETFTDLAKNLKAGQSVVLLVHHGNSSGFENNSSSFLYLAPQTPHE